MENWTTPIFASLSRFLDSVYPRFCLACQEPFDRDTHYFCRTCLSDLNPPSPALRCRHCFEMHEKAPDPCSRCLHRPLLSLPRAWVFDESAASQTLQQQLRQRGHLRKAIASYALMQLEQLDWCEYDLIIPLPDPLFARFRSAHKELARLLAELLGGESHKWLCRRSMRPFVWRLFLHPEARIEGRRILLFHIASQAQALAKAVGHLQGGHPRDIRALALFEPKEYNSAS